MFAIEDGDEAKKHCVGVAKSYCKKFNTQAEAGEYLKSTLKKNGEIQSFVKNPSSNNSVSTNYVQDLHENKNSLKRKRSDQETTIKNLVKAGSIVGQKCDLTKNIQDKIKNAADAGHLNDTTTDAVNFLKILSKNISSLHSGFNNLRNVVIENQSVLKNETIIEQVYDFCESSELQLNNFSNDITDILRKNDSTIFKYPIINDDISDVKRYEQNGIKDFKNADIIDGHQDRYFFASRQDSMRNDLIFEDDGFAVVYTDGACSHNGYAQARAGIGVYFGPGHPLNIAEPVDGTPTNNNAEIQAATKAINIVRQLGIKKLRIYTDSKFTINCITVWISKWKKNNWTLSTGGPVKNKESLIKLDNALKYIEQVDWKYVKGHGESVGNQMADKLAREGAEKYSNTTIYTRK